MSTNFAPGVNNVVQTVDGKEFYSVETFHSSPFYKTVTPVLIKDLVGSIDLLKIYGISGVRALHDGVIMINNHPLKKVRLVGRIIEYYIREFNSKEIYFLQLDDSTGSEILIKLQKSKLLEYGIDINDMGNYLISVVGVCKLYNSNLELNCESIEILDDGKTDRFLVEQLNFWREALKVRQQLKEPWHQVLQIDDSNYKKASKHSILNIDVDESKIDDSICIKNQEYIKLVNYKPSLSKIPFESQLSILIFKWLVKKSQLKINLNDIFKNVEINKILEFKAVENFPLQTVILPFAKIKSINDLKFEIFNQSISNLIGFNLIRLINFNVIEIKNLIIFYSFIINLSITTKIIKADKLLRKFEKIKKIKLIIDFNILNILIIWIIKRSKQQGWEFNETLKQWRCLR